MNSRKNSGWTVVGVILAGSSTSIFRFQKPPTTDTLGFFTVP
jgi:hypothetical protein